MWNALPSLLLTSRAPCGALRQLEHFIVGDFIVVDTRPEAEAATGPVGPSGPAAGATKPPSPPPSGTAAAAAGKPSAAAGKVH